VGCRKEEEPEISLAKTAKTAKKNQKIFVFGIQDPLFFLGVLGGLGENISSSSSSLQPTCQTTFHYPTARCSR
jgi:hypothetical protein